MLFARVVETSAAIGATRSRKAKVAAIAELLRDLDPADVGPVVAWLSGDTLQGRSGIGWRTLQSAQSSPAAEPSLDTGEVDRVFDEVAASSGAGSAGRRRELLTALLAGATAAEQRFLFRLLTGDLRQGALEGVMTEAIAVAADLDPAPVRRAVMLSGSVAATARIALADGVAGLGAVRLEVGRGIRPMLASPAESLTAAWAELGPAASVEYKLDGARIQVHRNDTDVHVFTRTLRDITPSVPEIVELALGLPCRSVVLDGETLALTDAGRPRPFQETMSRFGADLGERSDGGSQQARELALHPYFFDCLHLDGADLLDEPLSVRLDALERVAGRHRIPAVLGSDADAAAAQFDAALAAGHEGVMVKSLAAPYAAGRRGKSWQKVKPEHTLDLIVLGAEWGYGRRTGWLSNLHLGARDPDGGEPIMVGKTFKGLTDELLRWQTAEFPLHERDRDEHTVYLRPELVVEIELDGVQVSSRYPGGVALRFARVLRYRPDRSVVDADTIDTVRALLP